MFRIYLLLLTLFQVNYCYSFNEVDEQSFSHSIEEFYRKYETIDDAPYFVHVWFISAGNQNFLCGGVIILHDWVLTTASCLLGKDKGNIKVAYASTETFMGYRLHSADDLILHDDYKNHDIGLIRVQKPLKIKDEKRVIILPRRVLNTSEELRVLEIGVVEENNNRYPAQQWIKYLVTDQESCEKEYKEFKFTDGVFCTGKGAVINHCKGIVGSPLVRFHEEANSDELVGLLSWGHGYCQNSSNPYINTNVYYYLEWIDQQIMDSDANGKNFSS